MELPPSMHNLTEPVKVVGGRLIVNQNMMLPFEPYKIKFLGVDLVVVLRLSPDRVDIYQE